MKVSIFIFFVTILSLTRVTQVQSQNSESEQAKIKNVIIELFEAYRLGDSARVAATFTKDATLQTIHKNKAGQTELSKPVPITKLVNYIGDGLSEVHDERIWDTQIFYDQFMATVWTKYAFYLGKKFSHCGTEVFNLRKVEGEWKIFYLTDTRQMKDCDIPGSVK